MKERLIWLDSLKGWLILIVVLGHAIQYCLPESHDTNYWWNLIYSFHMPAFIAVSGYVNYRPKSNRQEWLNLCIRRTYQLFTPYLLWSLIKWLVLSNHTLAGLSNIIIKPDGYFWFLWVLWIITLVFIVGDQISTKLKVKQEAIIGVIALVLVVAMVFVNFRVCGFQFIAYYFLFYALGYYCNKYRSVLITNKILMVVLLFVWFVMGSFWNMHELPFFLKGIPFIPSALLQYAYRFMTAFVAIFLLFSAAPLMLNADTKINQKITHLGQLSLGLYVVHLTLIIPLSSWLVSKMPQVPINIVVCLSFALALIVSIAIVELLNSNKYTSRYLLGKI